jgi:hypothetical protein
MFTFISCEAWILASLVLCKEEIKKFLWGRGAVVFAAWYGQTEARPIASCPSLIGQRAAWDRRRHDGVFDRFRLFDNAKRRLEQPNSSIRALSKIVMASV